jgi:hypothetical protein
VSIIVPFSTDGTMPTMPSDLGHIADYLGVRVRINAAALSDTTYTRAVAAYTAVMTEMQGVQPGVLAALNAAGAEHVHDCAAALEADVSTAAPKCGGRTVDRMALVDTVTRAEASIAAMRTEVDRWYAGLDLRADFGDPTFSRDPAVRGTFMTGAVAAGGSWSLKDHVVDLTLRGRLGAIWSELSIGGAVRAGVDFAASIGVRVFGGSITSSPTSLSAISIDVGVEGRLGDRPPGTGATTQQDYLQLRGGVSIPLADGSAVGVALAVPLYGPGTGATLTLTGNWSLLLSNGGR